MDNVNVMAKLCHGGGSTGSIRSHRRRIVSEPTDSLASLSCDDTGIKLENLSQTNLLIRSDLKGEPQLHVHNNLISSPSMFVSNTDNDMEASMHLVSGPSDLFCGKPLQIDLDQHCINRHNATNQRHLMGMVKTFEQKDLTSGASSTKDLLQTISGQPQNQQHLCNECDRLFTRPERLRQHHAYKHTGNNNIGYSSCANNGNSISPTTNNGGTKLSDDLAGIQTATQHECVQCGKAFCSKFQLGRHAKIHSGEKAFLCSHCEQSFYRKDHLKTHEKTHQGSNDKVFFECERIECGKTYNSYSSYMKHRKTHESADSSLGGGGGGVGGAVTHGNGGTKHTLTMTQTAVDLKYRNNPTITQALPVVSNIQLRDTADNSTITSTVTSSSSTCSANPPTTTTPSRRSHREQGEKRFQCIQCSKKFPTSKDLKRHDVVHTGNREFQCSFCSHRFGRKDHRMRHEKKTHAIELLNNQQQNLSSNSGATTSGSQISGTNSTSLNRTTTHNNSPPNVITNNLQPSLNTNHVTSSSPSTSSPVSPPALIPIIANTSSPTTDTSFTIQPSHSSGSPNSISHQPYSPPHSHQFQLHDQLQSKINILALSPPSSSSSPCPTINLETTISVNRPPMANDNETRSQNVGLINSKRLQLENCKRWRHVSLPSTLQQVQATSSNIPVLDATALQDSVRANMALFPKIIVGNAQGRGIACGGNNSNSILLSRNGESDESLDINTLLAEQSIGSSRTDALMVSPKQEPPENRDFFQLCDNVSSTNVLAGAGALSEGQQTGEIILSQIKEEKEEKSIHNQDYNIEGNILLTDQPQLDSRTQAVMCTEDSSMMLSPLQLGHTLIKNDFILKKEDVEEQMDEMMDDDQPQTLSTQLQQTVRLKSEDECNGDIDWIITEIMTDPQLATTSSSMVAPRGSVNSAFSSPIKSSEDTSSLKSSPGSVISGYLSSSVPIGNALFPFPGAGISCSTSARNLITAQQLVVSQFSQPKVGSLDTTILYDDRNSAGIDVGNLGHRSSYSLTPKKLLGDLFTRTKNPVLPSIYTDSTLIVPEPKASKYHSPHQSLQMFENDFMDIDSFLKGGTTTSSGTGDGKDIPDCIFNM